MAVGHRLDPQWGNPVTVTGRVLRLSDGRFRYRGGIWDGVQGNMGPTAVLEVPSRGAAGAVRILLATHATYDWADEQFRSVDLDPAAAKFIVAKNPMNYHLAYSPLVTQRFVDAWMAFPGLLLLLTIMSIAGRGMAQIIIVLGVSGGIPASRVVRGAVLGVKENVYFQAAQAIGSSRRRSLLRHVLPNIAAPIIIIFSINVGGVIMSEAALSFLGFGLPPDIPSWGGMLSREGRQYMEIAPHLALWPGLCLTVVVYSLNMFGDAVRDLLDPRLRGRLGRYGAGKGQLTPS